MPLVLTFYLFGETSRSENDYIYRVQCLVESLQNLLDCSISSFETHVPTQKDLKTAQTLMIDPEITIFENSDAL